jgi:hypothetical protein
MSNKKIELIEKLKYHQFIENEEEGNRLIEFIEFFKICNDIKSFWYCFKLWFKRVEICNYLGISTPTLYALDKSIVSGNVNVSLKLMNRVKLLYELLKWYVEVKE